MKTVKCFNGFPSFLLAFVILTGISAAQTSKGSIAGTVKDASGGLVPGASITVTSTALGASRELVSDNEGQFRVDALLPGTYKIKVSVSGFSDLEIAHVEVRSAATATVNAVLEVSGRTESVVVSAGVEQELQTQSGDLSGNITRTEVAELPIGNLNPITLVLTLPGVNQPATRDDFTNGVGFSVNGTRPRGNNFLIDGQSNNDLSISGQAFQPGNPEAIAEVKIVTNSYSAEFGKGGGSVTNVVTRGGTNDFHGAAWDLVRNSALKAVDASDKAPAGNIDKKPVEVNNTFGFSFGGPAVKNRLFFFGTAQWDRFRSTASDSAVRLPTEAGVAALKSLPANPRVDALLSGMGDLRGDPNVSRSTIGLGFGRPPVETGLVTPSGISQFSNAYETSVRGDYLPTNADTLSVRYLQSNQTFAPDTLNNPGQLPGFRTQQGGPSKILSSSWVHSFNANALNEFRFAWNLIDFSFGLLPQTAANPAAAGPTSIISGNGFLSGAGIGVNSAFPQGRANQTWQFQDLVSVTRGKHNLKLGFDIANFLAEQSVPFNGRGTITYNTGGDCGGAPCTALANFVDDFTGSAGTVAKVFGSPLVRPDQTIQGYYLEDSWRVRHNLTLNMGVRYEYFGTPLNVLNFPAVAPELGQFSQSFPARIVQEPDRNDVAPRFGFAYTPQCLPRLFGKGKTVIRGGYGMFYDGLFNNILVNAAASAPNVAGGTIVAPTGRGLADASALISTIAPAAPNPALGVVSVVSDIVSPITHQWNMNIERELPANLLLTAAYVGTAGVRLFGTDELNFRVDGVRLNPSRGAITVRANGRHSSYHGGQFTLDRRFSRGMLLRGAYTFSRTLDNGSEVFITSGGASRVQDFFNYRGDKGLSVFHRKHRVALTYVYEIPFVKSEGAGWSALRAVTRDWQLSGTYFYQTGAPETIFVGGIDTNSDGNAFNGRPNLGSASAPFNSVGIDGALFGVAAPSGMFFEAQNFLNCDDVTIPCQPARPASDFRFLVQPGPGNVGRNTVTTNGRHDWNLGIVRRFKIPVPGLETQQLEFRAEMFNPFNHPNQGIPILDVLDPDFNNNAITRFGGREIRFWLKWRF